MEAFCGGWRWTSVLGLHQRQHNDRETCARGLHPRPEHAQVLRDDWYSWPLLPDRRVVDGQRRMHSGKGNLSVYFLEGH